MHVNKILLIALTATVFSFSPLPVTAGSFNDAVNDSKSPEHKEPQHNEQQYQNNDSTNSLTEFLIQLIAIGWFYNNFTARYTAYPYANGNKYIVFNSSALAGSSSTSEYTTRMSRFSADTSAVWLGDLGFGNESTFEGFLAAGLGPYFENLIVNDSSNNSTGNIRLGGQISLFQSNPLSLALIFQWSHFYGDAATSLPQNGFAYGAIFRSYPFNPIVLEWRISAQDFSDNVVITDSNLQAGFMLERFEIFAAWRAMWIGNNERNDVTDRWDGATLGARVYF
jgi:hypothetical protein